MKILLVEDEKIFSDILQERLQRSGDTVEIALDGEAGIAAVKSFHPDVIVLDLMLPKKNGFEVMEAIKADPASAGIPILVLSNLGDENDIKHAMQLGATDFFIKVEHSLSEIVEKVEHMVVKK